MLSIKPTVRIQCLIGRLFILTSHRCPIQNMCLRQLQLSRQSIYHHQKDLPADWETLRRAQ